MSCEHGCRLHLDDCPGQQHIGICAKVAQRDPEYVALAYRLAGRKLPPLWRMAWNFTRAAIHHIRAGMPKATRKTQASRLAICQACPRYLADSKRCSHANCGCHMELKTSWELSTCPEGKW